MRTRTLFLSAVTVLVMGVGVALAQSPAPTSQKYSLNFKDVEITTLAETVATATGKTFVLHPQVHGIVNLISEQPMTASEMYSAFVQVVVVQGYVVEESGGVIKIYPGKPRN